MFCTVAATVRWSWWRFLSETPLRFGKGALRMHFFGIKGMDVFVRAA
jgi:hypothetical protein